MTKERSTLRKLGFASLIMMASVFLSRIIGLLREMTIAYAGGAGGEVDAYQVAFIIPEILNHIVASGFLSVTFIPIFASYLAKDDEEEGWRVFSIIFNTFGVLLLIFIAAAFLLAPELVRFFAPGFKDHLLFDNAVKMTRIIMPAQFFFFAGGMFMSVQYTKEKFLIPAIAPIVYNLGIIVGGLAGSHIGKLLFNTQMGMEGFAWGVVAGSFAGNFALQYFGAKKVGMKIYPLINIRHPEFIKYILLTIPLMAGLSMTFSTEIFLKYFGSYMADGSIAAMNYAIRIMFILVGIFGQAVGVASFPFLASLASRGKIYELNSLLNTTLRYLLLVIPVSVLFMVLRHEIVFLLFQRGRFDLKATQITSQVLPFIMAGTFAYAAQTVVVRGYYAMQNTWFPALFGTIAVFASLPLFFIFMKIMGTPGVALGLSCSAFMNSGLLYILWNRRSGNSEAVSVYRFMVKMVFLSIVIGALLFKLESFLQTLFKVTSVHGAIAISAISGSAFLILFLTAGTIMKIEEILILIRRVAKKMRLAA